MKWLARLKKIEIVPEPEATETTKTVSVVFVAPILAPVQKTGGDSPAANDPAIQVQAPADDSTLTGRDADTFTARLVRFTTKGVTFDDAEQLADKLATRDRESDDRRLCLECNHLAGYGAGSWRCGNWQRAGIALQTRDAGLPGDLVRLLQRCNGFKGT